MTCAATMTDAMASDALVSWPHQVTNQPSPCVPAENIEHGPKESGRTAIIASRCKRLRHSNNVQRVRYMTLHRTLSKLSGDA